MKKLPVSVFLLLPFFSCVRGSPGIELGVNRPDLFRYNEVAGVGHTFVNGDGRLLESAKIFRYHGRK